MGWGGRVLTPFGHSLMISHKKIYEQDVGSDIETCFRILFGYDCIFLGFFLMGGGGGMVLTSFGQLFMILHNNYHSRLVS